MAEVRHSPAPERPAGADLTHREHELLRLFIKIHEDTDPALAAELLREDVRVTMPPHPWCYQGRDAVLSLMRGGTGANGPGEWRLAPARANRMPAAASYLRAWGTEDFVAFKLDVIDIRNGLFAEITTFDARLFGVFGLPPAVQELPARVRPDALTNRSIPSSSSQ